MSSSVRQELEDFVAGRVKAERLVIAVAAEYYRDTGNGKRETLRPLIDVIDRASPGIVELGVAPGGSGFEIRPARCHPELEDRKSTRLNSSHSQISYAVFCLKKKKKTRSRKLTRYAL